MKTYQIEVKETLARTIEMEAISADDAISKVKNLYKKEEIVLDASDFMEVDFMDLNSPIINEEKNRLLNEVIDYLFDEEQKHFEELNEPDNHIFIKLKRLKKICNE